MTHTNRPDQTDHIIRLERVTKVFRQGEKEVRALHDVSFSVPRAGFVSIMGPSGSGKSTLLHLLGGIDTPSSGEIYIDGRGLSGMSDDELTLFRLRRIGVVFQFFNLLPTLSAEENVALPLLLDGHRLKDVRPRVARLLDLVGLGHRGSHRPDALSGGEMQRVAIARALVADPALLLADEPTGNLDGQTGEEVLKLIRDAAQATGQTVVLVTHDARAAGRADHIFTLNDGRIADGA